VVEFCSMEGPLVGEWTAGVARTARVDTPGVTVCIHTRKRMEDAQCDGCEPREVDGSSRKIEESFASSPPVGGATEH
jgi:hypothetical protein